MAQTTTKQIKRVASACKQKARKDTLYQEIEDMRDKFQEYRLYEADSWSWTLMHDFLACQEWGMHYKKQRAKAVEVLLKYGEDTLFWSELKKTKRQRQLDMQRVAHVVRSSHMALDKGGMFKKDRCYLQYSDFYLEE